MMKKFRLVGFIASVVIIAVISELNNITLFSKFGGITLIPVLYFLVTYVVPYKVKSIVDGLKKPQAKKLKHLKQLLKVKK